MLSSSKLQTIRDRFSFAPSGPDFPQCYPALCGMNWCERGLCHSHDPQSRLIICNVRFNDFLLQRSPALSEALPRDMKHVDVTMIRVNICDQDRFRLRSRANVAVRVQQRLWRLACSSDRQKTYLATSLNMDLLVPSRCVRGASGAQSRRWNVMKCRSLKIVVSGS